MKTTCPSCQQHIDVDYTPKGGIECPTCFKYFVPTEFVTLTSRTTPRAIEINLDGPWNLTALGAFIFFLGIGGMIYSLTYYDTTVFNGTQAVNNFGLLSNRECGMIASATGTLVGMMLIVGGLIRDAIHEIKK